MRGVSNTSPLSSLAIIGRLDLLRRRYSEILIPPEVAAELTALRHPAGNAHIATAIAGGWLRVEKPAGQPAIKLFPQLDTGETAAIRLALALKADVLLIDEKRGRAAARAAGLAVGGLLGELLHARQQGWLPSLREEVDRLRKEAGFFVDVEIERFILSQVGE